MKYKSKVQGFGKTLFEELPPITATFDQNDIPVINILDDTPDLKVLQQEDACYQYIWNSLHLPLVQT